MGQFEIAGHEVVDRDVKATGDGAHVAVYDFVAGDFELAHALCID